MLIVNGTLRNFLAVSNIEQPIRKRCSLDLAFIKFRNLAIISGCVSFIFLPLCKSAPNPIVKSNYRYI